MDWNKNDTICEICGGNGKLVHQGVRDRQDVDVYECTKCRTKFLVSTQILENDYEKGFMYHGDSMDKMPVEKRLQEFEADDTRRYNLVKELCKNKKVLDFGCGFGGFLDKIKNDGNAIVAGVELSEFERNYLNEKGIMCKRDIEEFDGTFDIITMFHVLEHLKDPRDWLVKLSYKLNPGGKLIIEVPNANDILLSLYQSEAFADFTYWSAHLMLYTTESLEKLINSTNCYKIVDSTQIQRYTLANHMYWLAMGGPGGHKKWSFLDDVDLNETYEKKLRELEMCDTLYVICEVN